MVPPASGFVQMPTLPGVRGNSEDEHWQDPEIQAARNGEGDLAAGTLCIELPPQRAQPSRKRLAEESNLLAALRLAIERCPPLHECPVAVHDGHEPQGCPVILHRCRPYVSKFVGLRPLDIGHSEQFLANSPALVQNVAHGTDCIARFAGLDFTFSRAIDPDGIVVEVSDYVPDLVSRLFEDRTIIASCHADAPKLRLCISWWLSPPEATRFLTHLFDSETMNA